MSFIINPYIYGGGYLLNNYPSSSGYSVRLLKNSYSGALVRIRRSSDSAEKDFYPDSNDELSMSSEDGAGTSLTTWISTDSGYIVTWYDQEETADMTQSTAANQPRIVNAGTLETKGGKTAVYFDGTNDYVSRSAFTSLYTYPFTIIGVSSNDASAAQGVVFSQRLPAGDQSGISLFCDRRTDTVGALLDDGSTSHKFNYPAQINTADQRLQTFIITSGGNGELWKDGTSQESIASIGAFSTQPNTVADIGRQQAGPLYIQGFVQELIVWATTDETSNRTAIENDINENYDLYWNGQNTSLLDDYGSAAAAYSFRNLDSSYTGALVRIRRSSDNAERDFYGTWNGEFPTTAVQDWVGANNGFVVTWYDQSGNSNDISQSTAADQPSIVSSGVVNTKNFKPSTIYDGTSDFLTRANLTALNAYPFSVFGVGCNNDSAELAPIVSQRNSTGDFSGCSMFFDRTANAIGFSIDQGASNALFNYPSQLDNTNQRIQSFCITSGSDGELWLNGTSQETISGVSSYATALTANLNIGKQDVGPLDSLMHIQEVIIYNSDQTSNQSAIETNINNFYLSF
jgi:hypothetical protein